MVVVQADAQRITVQQFRTLERAATDARHEYYDGYLYAIAGGTRRHAVLGGNTYALLAEAVAAGPCRAYNSDMRVRVSETVQLYPDVTVSCDERDEENAEDDEIAHPRLVVEVLSSHTERIDRGRKLRYYQSSPTIEEYALVNSEYRAVEVYRRGERDWTYHRYEDGNQVVLVSIGARLSLADFYKRTTVPASPPSPHAGIDAPGDEGENAAVK